MALLARIKAKMKENLAGLPNYTCTETVERFSRWSAQQQFQLVDALRFEVAVVGGKELYALPGEQNFQEREISSVAPGGAIGSGSFALHARAVFLDQAPTFNYLGKRIEGGRELVGYSYNVPQFQSAFYLRVGKREARVGFQGAFWADAVTLDLVRLDVVAVDIPPALQLDSSSDSMQYRRTRIGESDFLLPASSEMLMVEVNGAGSRNRTTFSTCRQYAGESKVSFDDPSPDALAAPAAAPAARKETALPPGLALLVHLKGAIVFGKSAVGDEVKAGISFNVKQRGEVVIPKGATIHGRLKRLEKLRDSGIFAVAIDFTAAEFPGTIARFSARIDKVGKAAIGPQADRLNTGGERPDPTTFFVQSVKGVLDLPGGYLILLRTLESNGRKASP